MIKTIFDVNDVASIRLDHATGTLTVNQKSKAESLFIHSDDVLYPQHLKNFESLCKQLVDAYPDEEHKGEEVK